jgi:hypothetical protein
MRIASVANLIAATLVTCATALFAIGVLSTYWPKTSAVVENSDTERVTLYGYGTRGAIRATNLDVEVASYSYSVGGRSYVGSLVCFCLPLGWKTQVAPGAPATVSFFAPRPQWSVLNPGPDVFSTVALVALALLSSIGGRAINQTFGGDV